MSENEDVLIARDDGQKDRWSLSKFSYFKDGPKKTLRSKKIKWIAFLFFGLTAFWALLKSPEVLPKSKSQNNSIPLNEPIGSSTGGIEIKNNQLAPAAPTSGKRKLSKAVKFDGLGIQRRPQFDKIPPGIATDGKLVSGGSDGMIKVILTSPLRFNGDELMQEGTILIGQGTSGEDRLQVQFTKVLFTDGTTQNVQAQAVDESDDLVGIKGSKVSKYSSLLAASAGLSFLAGMSEGLQEKEPQGSVQVPKIDLKNASLRGVQVAGLEQSKEILNRWKESKSQIEVPKGTKIKIIFTGE